MLSGSAIRDLEYRIEASLIGKNVRIGRGPALPKAYRFVVGDNADVQILVRLRRDYGRRRHARPGRRAGPRASATTSSALDRAPSST